MAWASAAMAASELAEGGKLEPLSGSQNNSATSFPPSLKCVLVGMQMEDAWRFKRVPVIAVLELADTSDHETKSKQKPMRYALPLRQSIPRFENQEARGQKRAGDLRVVVRFMAFEHNREQAPGNGMAASWRFLCQDCVPAGRSSDCF
ncbi:hypothetical protein BaRGS_00017028, partial [Batillaria attramentaria]